MAGIIEEILKFVPDPKKISDSCFEGANIVLYTKDKEFFLDDKGSIREAVNAVKKRIELRPDPAVTLDVEEAEKLIKKIIPEEAAISKITFDPQRSRVILEAEKPGLAIGKQGEILREIKKKTLWVPIVRRSPSLRSKIIDNIRAVLYQYSDYRRKFLDKVGHRIYDGWKTGKKDEWIRVTFLGGARQVGRSCVFLQTPESRILLDCGVNVAATEQNQFPHLDAPEFKLDELDAVILSHAHLDHSGLVPWLFKMGYKGPVYCTAPTRDVTALLALDFIGVAVKEAKNSLFSSTDVKEMVKHTICLDYEEVTDITPDMRITFYNAGHVLGSALTHLHIGNGLHNLMYSLDWKTPVVVFDDNERVEFEPIGRLTDELFEKYPDLIKKKRGYEELDNVDGIKTISFNPETYKTEVKTITGFIRHPISEDLYEIKTASGRTAAVTKSHSVFSVFDNEIRAVKVSDLNTGDFIIGPKLIPRSDKVPLIDLLEHKNKLRVRIDDDALLTKLMENHANNFHKLNKKDKSYAKNWLLDHYKFGMYKKDIAKKYKVHPRRIVRTFKVLGVSDHPRVKHALPNKLTINKDLARFLGYYIAEGSIRKNSQTLVVTNYNKDILEDCRRIIKNNFNIDTDVRETEILINSKQLKYLLCEVLKCGKNAYTKRAPREILFSDKEILKNFLYGYFSGDGGIRIRSKGREIMAGSKNPLLIQDITFMLLQFGIVPTLQYNAYNEMYIATIYNKDKIQEFLHEIGILNGALNKLKSALETIRSKASFDLRIPMLSLSKKAQVMLTRSAYRNAKSCGINVLKNKFDVDERIMKSDFMFDQIVSIKKVKPIGKYVYDFKVEGYENFLGGSGFLFLHNTGDFKGIRTRLLDPAATRFPRLETAIIESTYGAKTDIVKSRVECESELLGIIKAAIERGGKILIPVLGVGRAQEIVVIIEEAVRTGKIPKVPVFVQGLVWDVTAIHTAYPDFLGSEMRKLTFHKDQNPFLSDYLKRVGSRKEQEEVINETGSCVIIATSGMMTAGASVAYFKAMAEDPRNAIVFVSYLGEGTLGRKVQSGEKTVTVPGEKPEPIAVNLSVHSIPGMTGHAARDELMRYVHALDPKPKKIIVNHGESSKCLDLASSIHKLERIETNAPKNLESIRIR